jgi:L-fuculose-phosphate aldolase
VLPYVKETNVLLLGSHGVVTFDTDLEQAYYKFEVVESYAKLLILAKQLGSVERFDAEQMEGLLALKSRFGMDDPRRKSGEYEDRSEYLKTIKTRQAGRNTNRT